MPGTTRSRTDLAFTIHKVFREELHDRDRRGRFAETDAPAYDDDDLTRLASYSGDGMSDDVNPWLRGDPPEYLDADDPDDVAEMQAVVDSMDRIAAAMTLDEPTTVYRIAPLGKLKLGDLVTDDAFMSTTTKRAVALKYGTSPEDVVVRIDLPAGTHAIPHHKLNRGSVGAAGEVILPRKTTIRITGEDGDMLTAVIE